MNYFSITLRGSMMQPALPSLEKTNSVADSAWREPSKLYRKSDKGKTCAKRFLVSVIVKVLAFKSTWFHFILAASSRRRPFLMEIYIIGFKLLWMENWSDGRHFSGKNQI